MLYEDQAASFDERAAIPAGARESVAAAVVEISGLRQGDTLLDIGVGTGMLSLPLLKRPIRYIGLDLSPAMLAIFHKKAEEAQLRAELLVADANDRWPVEDGSIVAVFSARALHHVDVDHAATEIRRVLGPQGGWLVLGRVQRPDDSMMPTLRRQMRKLLKDEGYTGRNHEAYTETLFSTLEAAGGERAKTWVAARWTRRNTPLDSISAWQGKEGLAGNAVPKKVKERVLGRLHAWAEEYYGNLKASLEQEESFQLDAIHVQVV